MKLFELIAFALGVYSLVKGVLSHLVFNQLAKELKGDFAHYSWDREHPVSKRSWSDKGEPFAVTESRIRWNRTKTERDSADDRRIGYILLAMVCFGIFLNALRSL